MAAWDGPTFVTYVYLAQKPDITRCIYSNLDRLCFYENILIIFGTVYTLSEKMSNYGFEQIIFSLQLYTVNIKS